MASSCSFQISKTSTWPANSRATRAMKLAKSFGFTGGLYGSADPLAHDGERTTVSMVLTPIACSRSIVRRYAPTSVWSIWPRAGSKRSHCRK
ncbi:hypothetical protein LRS13_06990 [Svornostia abyssi]|uniref:Uncharacterized protein n=1 Tax=Svornostia abyssi TaxID=2898438 RepID=A0ABY5PKV8_9ACTN|nr:hypothetical protein LRS13_06990 [Parviterribacteraceae bacterium J379]